MKQGASFGKDSKRVAGGSRAVWSEASTISNNLQKRVSRHKELVSNVSFDKETKLFMKPKKIVNNDSEFSRKYKIP